MHREIERKKTKRTSADTSRQTKRERDGEIERGLTCRIPLQVKQPPSFDRRRKIRTRSDRSLPAVPGAHVTQPTPGCDQLVVREVRAHDVGVVRPAAPAIHSARKCSESSCAG